MNKKKSIKISDLVPILVFIGLVVVFAIITQGNSLTKFNIKSILEQAIPYILGGAGMIFVVTTGSADLSHGSILAIVAIAVCITTNSIGAWFTIPAGIIIGAIVGTIAGITVAKLKVSSFLATLSLMIALRALTKFLLTSSSILAGEGVMTYNKLWVKIPVTIVLVAILWYVFEYTRFGAYCKCIGENELTCASSGIDTTKIKILAFVLSGTMAGIAGAFNVARMGGASTTIGNMFEMRVMMSLYIGGIPISGGTKSKMYKLPLGAFILAVLENGLTISGVSGSLYEFIEGVVLITVVATTLFLNRQGRIKGQKIAAESTA